MSAETRLTKARSVDGKIMVEQPDGTLRELQSLTDWQRVDSFTEEDIERMAREDGDDQAFPDDLEPARVLRPSEPVER